MTFVRPWYLRRTFLISMTCIGTPIGLYAYDRYQCKQLLDKYVQFSTSYGQAPLSTTPTNNPTKITILVEAENRDQLLTYFKDYFLPWVQPIWTAAGIDYEWLECSHKKHVNEFKKLEVDPLITKDLPEEVDLEPNQSEEIKEKFLVKEFDGTTTWRLKKWFRKDLEMKLTHDILLADERTNSGSGWWSYLKSFIWSGYSFENSIAKAQAKVLEKSSFLKDEALATSLLKSDYRELLIEKSRENLLPASGRFPQDATGFAAFFQEGIFGMGKKVTSNILDTYRLLQGNYADDWKYLILDKASGSPYAKVGYIPLLYDVCFAPWVKQESLEFPREPGFLERSYLFFNRRQYVQQLMQVAMAVVENQVQLWNSTLEHQWPSNILQVRKQSNDAALESKITNTPTEELLLTRAHVLFFESKNNKL